MSLETGTYISDLNASNPTSGDPKSQGDDHLRLIKSTVKATFPNVSGAVTPTHTELNYVDGVTSAIQTQLDAKSPSASPTFTGTVVLPATTSIGTVSATELGYVDGVTSAIQAQIDAKAPLASPTFTGTVVLPATTSISTVSATEISYLDGVTSAIQTQLDQAKATNGTAQASTSGTSIDFTSIPSWVKRLTINFVGVSTNGTDNIVIQLGDSGGVETTGYLGTSCTGSGTDVSLANATNGFNFGFGSAAAVMHGSVELSLQDGSTWTASGCIANSNVAQMSWTAGSKATSATLDRVRITTVSGVNTFDAGSINVQYD